MSLVFGSAPRSVNALCAYRVPGSPEDGFGKRRLVDFGLEVHPCPVGLRISHAMGRHDDDGGRDQRAAATESRVGVSLVEGDEADVRMSTPVPVSVGDGVGDACPHCKDGDRDRYDTRAAPHADLRIRGLRTIGALGAGVRSLDRGGTANVAGEPATGRFTPTVSLAVNRQRPGPTRGGPGRALWSSYGFVIVTGTLSAVGAAGGPRSSSPL